MADAASDERFEEAARFRNRLLLGSASRRASGGGGQARRRDRGRRGHRDRGRERGSPGLPPPRREDGRPLRVPPRERRGAGCSCTAGGVRARVLRLGTVGPAADHRPARGGGHVRACRVPFRTPWLACGGARVRAGEKRRLQELANQNAGLALEADTARAEQSRLRRVEALRLPRGAQSGEPPAPDRVLRRLEHPGGVAGRVDGGLPGRDTEEGALPEVRHPREGRGRTTTRRSPRPSRGASPASARRRRRSTTKASRWRPTSS